MRYPTLDAIRADYLRDLQNTDAAADINVGSDNYTRASALAALGEGQYQHQAWILRQVFADTADRDYLERHCANYGIARKQATAADGTATVHGTTGTTFAAGTTLTAGGHVYHTRAAVTLTGVTATVAVIAAATGSAYNLGAATHATIADPPQGGQSSAAVGKITGGSDVETDAALLARYLERLQYPPAGGNQYDYHRWCMSVDGVAAAIIYPLRRGNGFVDAVILGQDGLPSAETLAAVQQYVDRRRPVTRADGFLALMPDVIKSAVKVQIGYDDINDQSGINAAVRQAITDFYAALNPAESLYKSQLEAAISDVPGVRDRRVIKPARNIAATVTDKTVPWIRLTGVTIQAMV